MIPSVNLIPSIADLYKLAGDREREKEAYQMHCNFSEVLLNDHFQAAKMPQHALIQWTTGPPPVIPPSPANPT